MAAPTWTPSRVTYILMRIATVAWVRESVAWVKHTYCDDLEVSYLDADQNVVYGPVQLGTPDGPHYSLASGSFTGDSSVLSTYDVYGVKIHHRDPGESLPFWFAVDYVVFTPAATGVMLYWDASTVYDYSTELTPTYEAVPPGLFPYLWVPTGFRTYLPRAVYDTNDGETTGPSFPTSLSGGPLSIDSAWLASLNASTATSVEGDLSPLPDDDEFVHFAEIVAEPPLGDLVVMFGHWSQARAYLRQRQSPRANPRVSLNRPQLRQRQRWT